MHNTPYHNYPAIKSYAKVLYDILLAAFAAAEHLITNKLLVNLEHLELYLFLFLFSFFTVLVSPQVQLERVFVFQSSSLSTNFWVGDENSTGLSGAGKAEKMSSPWLLRFV